MDEQYPAELLSRLTVRLPAEGFERLRRVSFLARRRPAEVARDLILRGLDSKYCPQEAPPSVAELAPRAGQLLTLCRACVSNIRQIEKHALDIGEPITGIAREGGVLHGISEKLRIHGLAAKSGKLDESSAELLLGRLAEPSEALNQLARSLNIDRSAVPVGAWYRPISNLRDAL